MLRKRKDFFTKLQKVKHPNLRKIRRFIPLFCMKMRIGGHELNFCTFPALKFADFKRDLGEKLKSSPFDGGGARLIFQSGTFRM